MGPGIEGRDERGRLGDSAAGAPPKGHDFKGAAVSARCGRAPVAAARRTRGGRGAGVTPRGAGAGSVVEDGKLSKADLKKRLARLEAASAELALPIEISVAPEPTSVAATLLRLVQVGSSRTTAPLARSCSSWPSAR